MIPRKMVGMRKGGGPGVTISIKVNGRAVKHFPWRLYTDTRVLTPEKAMKLIQTWMDLARE